LGKAASFWPCDRAFGAASVSLSSSSPSRNNGETTDIGKEQFTAIPHVFPMCDKCAELDKRIEHYSLILLSIGDRLTVEGLVALIADLRAQKAALHSDQKQQ
jgi:hypothetical protein